MHPTPSRCWEIIDKHQVNIFYTAPTAIRTLMREGDQFVKQCSRASLKLLGSVGEPINPNAWQWYHDVVGGKRCSIVDTWWQTETGGIMITPLPGATPEKPGAASWPFFGVQLAIVDDQGKTLTQEAAGNLVITHPWPGQAQTIHGDSSRFHKTYFSQYPGFYFTGDTAHRDKDHYYWILGRSDDVINVSGHRLDTAEIESALVAHSEIAEAAVVGFPHDIKGQGIYAFDTPKKGITTNDTLKEVLIALTREKIGAIAKPDYIQWTNDLPKTRSGKIMRRLLRQIASGHTDFSGDLSTLANPESLQAITADFSEFRGTS